MGSRDLGLASWFTVMWAPPPQSSITAVRGGETESGTWKAPAFPFVILWVRSAPS